MKLKTLAFAGCGIFLASSAALACDRGPGAMDSIQHNFELSRLAFPIGLLILTIQAIRSYRRTGLTASLLLLAGFSVFHPTWWVSSSGDCGYSKRTASVAFTVAAIVLAIVLPRIRSEGWRTLLAFALAPVLPCALAVLALGAQLGSMEQARPLLFGMLMSWEWLIVVMAMPGYLVLKRFYRIQFAQCVIAGAVVGSIPALSGPFPADVSSIGLGVAFGVVTGACFWWLLASFRQPVEDTVYKPIPRPNPLQGLPK